MDNDENPIYVSKSQMSWGSIIVYGIMRLGWFYKLIKVNDNQTGIKYAKNLK